MESIIKKVKVCGFTSPRGNNPVPNQYDITISGEARYFQSYSTMIAKIDNEGKVTLDPQWNYSVTTSKYRNEFLGEDTKTTKKKIASGEYIITNLN